jgi:hypothetical protein
MTVLFGYTPVSEAHCGVCGENYLAMERVDGADQMRCWCGSTCKVTFDSDAERAEFIERYKVKV